MSDFADFQQFEGLRVTLASPEVIRSWSRGEVKEPETINYRTFRPEKGGLFGEEIFGPTRDFECYCGKYRKVRFKGVICDKCGVEVTRRSVRRERMGHIELASPCAHIWFFGTVPSKIATLLGVNPQDLKAVIYYSKYLVMAVAPEKKRAILNGLAGEVASEKEALGKEAEVRVAEILKASEKEAKKYTADEKKRQEVLLVGRKEAARLRDELVVNQINLERKYEVLEEHLVDIAPLSLINEAEYYQLGRYLDQFAKVRMGAEAVQEALKDINIDRLAKELQAELGKTKSEGRRLQLVSRFRVVNQFKNSGTKPEWMVLTILPVIPPELRPMVQLEGGRFATSDLNDLYRVIINRNNRLRSLLELGAPEIILRNEKRMLQEAVDALIAGPGLERRRGSQKELRSLSELIKGKQGRFRRNLLGKRVDYSGRSVIVVGPELKLYECGLPREMALELFKPMVIREILLEGFASNARVAKDFLEARSGEVWDILERVVEKHPILLNRAPTLHRLGIEAFYPKLSEGNAIKIHPSVCAGYNADFDGDQMAVHVPLSRAAIKEAETLMLSSKNILKPSSGAPIVTPTKDIVLGIYWLTKAVPGVNPPSPHRVLSVTEALLSCENGYLPLREEVSMEIAGEVIETTLGRVLFNQVLPESLRFVNQAVGGSDIRKITERCFEMEGEDRVVQLIDDLKELGFSYATQSGISMGIFDTSSVPGKEAIITEAEEKVAGVEGNLVRGLITDEERKRLSQEIWLDATNRLAEMSWKSLDEDNPVRMTVESGARGSKDQVKQMVGMKGLVMDPTGAVIELPTKSNYFEGLTEFEYFAGTRGSRKGLVDTALRTADAGYLTRRLVDVSQDILVREEDCGTVEGWEIRRNEGEELASLAERIFGRVLARPIKKKGGETLAKRNELLTKARAREIEEAGVESVWVRSPLTCKTRWGICQRCYGADLGWGRLVGLGAAVGVIAAESIGEPGTQLTLHGKQAGKGIVGAMEIIQGLPRVEQLFEARLPRVLAEMSHLDGKVTRQETTEAGTVIKIVAADGEEEHLIPPTLNVLVDDGQLVVAGTPLSSGYSDPKEILKTLGVKAAEGYILAEIQRVYASQGVSLNDKHIEVILRQMFSKVRVKSAGATSFLPGDVVSRDQFLEANEAIEKGGGEKARGEQLVLGVTRVALKTESWLSAASFQATTRVLADAAVEGICDPLRGLKENVIVGKRIPVNLTAPGTLPVAAKASAGEISEEGTEL